MDPDMPTFNDAGNFVIRLGYVTGSLRNGNMRTYLLKLGAAEEQITAAYDALVALCDTAFYGRKPD